MGLSSKQFSVGTRKVNSGRLVLACLSIMLDRDRSGCFKVVWEVGIHLKAGWRSGSVLGS